MNSELDQPDQSETIRKDLYQDYFKGHYKFKFSSENIENYGAWFFSQWSLIKPKIKMFDSKEKFRSLEIGSGFGGFYNILRKNNLDQEYVGLELDSAAADFSCNFFGTQAFLNKSLNEYVAPKPFQLVFAFEVLEHLENPTASLRKIAQLLTDDGIFCGTTPYPYEKNVLADNTHLSVLHPTNWERLFKMAGFKTVEIYPMSFFPLLWRIHPKLNIRLPFFVPFSGFISTSLVLARK